MLPILIHQTIDQGLQNVASFIYQDLRETEVDLQFNRVVNKFIRMYFEPKEKDPKNDKFPGFEQIEVNLDDLRLLIESDNIIAPTGDNLPDNYRYLISDRSIIDHPCSNIIVKSGDIKPTKIYKNKGTTTIIYATDPYPPEYIFTGALETVFTSQEVGIEKVVLLDEVTNRLTKQDRLTNVLGNYFEKTKYTSPVSKLTKKSISVYQTDFSVEKIVIDYIRIPIKLVWDSGTNWLEFPEEVIEMLCDLTVKRLLEMTQSKRYETKTIEDS